MMARILVADGCVDTVETMTWLLRSWGHEVVGVCDGTAALEAARSYRPEVVLTELALPGIDGFEVARRLRRQKELAQTRLVAVTGYGQDRDRRRAREAGFDLHLIKPADPEVLRELLDRHLGAVPASNRKSHGPLSN
jgi:CheY-like chemotaxis protein